MKISHTWTNEDGIEMAWATPSRREIAECRKAGREDVLEYCEAPRGWDFADDDDTSDDGGHPGRYLVRGATTPRRESGGGGSTNSGDSTAQLVCGYQIQRDLSGQGHAWRDISAADLPANIREEIEGAIIDGGVDETDLFIGTNGIHYRW